MEKTLRTLRPHLLSIPTSVREKERGRGPVTELDVEVDEALHREISRHFPEDGWISEESPEVQGKGRIWVVDPIDGTRELIRGIPEWVVSIALFVKGSLHCGWIYHPQSDTLWFGVPSTGAWKNGKSVKITHVPSLSTLRIGVSRTDWERGRIPSLPLKIIPIGSIAYKLALVGGGELDGVISVTPKRLWDIAGGVAILLGGGGAILDLNTYEALTTLSLMPGKIFPRGFVAAHPRWLGGVTRILRRHKG